MNVISFAFVLSLTFLVISVLVAIVFGGVALILRRRSQPKTGDQFHFRYRQGPSNMIAVLSLVVAVLSLVSSTVFGILQFMKR